MTSLKSWERRHYQAGGGDALLFYVAFGDLRSDPPPMDATKYRSAGASELLRLSHYSRKKHPDVFHGFQTGYLWERLKRDDPSMAEGVAAAGCAVLLRGEIPDPPNLNYLRDAVGMLAFLLDQGAVCIFDPQMFRWWSPRTWRSELFDPDGPVPRHHVSILVSEETEPGHSWLHTRGLRKFGRPDVSVHDVTDEYLDATTELCDRFIEFQAFGGLVPEGQEIKMASLPEGGRVFHGGSLEDPEFNNLHFVVSWASVQNQSLQRTSTRRFAPRTGR